MSITVSASDGVAPRVGVVVPLRSLTAGKLRLRATLTADERATLIHSMASAVVAAAHELPVLIVYDDPAVAIWATRLGADSITTSEPGLNAAVEFGRARLIEQGFDHVIVAHADLPHALDLRPVGQFDGITLVPDRAGDGTNVLSVPSDVDFTFCYGPGSFATHLRLAEATGRDVRVFNDPQLAWDVDHPDDLGPFIPPETVDGEGRDEEDSDVTTRS